VGKRRQPPRRPDLDREVRDWIAWAKTEQTAVRLPVPVMRWLDAEARRLGTTRTAIIVAVLGSRVRRDAGMLREDEEGAA